jgi:hypothetical protein
MRFFKPIERKETNKIIARISERLTAIKKELDINKLKTHVKYGILYQNEMGQWRIVDNQPTARIPSGLYTYVCTKAGFIRLEPLLHGETKHLVLSDYADEIRYAGWISFKKDGSGDMEYWNNDSGGYKPSPYQCQQAGLPIELFQNLSISPRENETTDNMFDLDTHQQAIKQAAANTIIGAFRHYKTHLQGNAYQVLRAKEQAIVVNNTVSIADEMPTEAITVSCS